MKYTYLILVVVALASAQNPKKHGKGKYAQGGGGGPQYAPQEVSHGGGQYQHQHQQQSHGGFSAPQKQPVYPLLLSDSRTLNTDGSINFNYAADNGLQQGETVDADGTRRGFYSYPGADGKPITVKYTAGINGFVAEGDHLPRQPQGAAHSDKDEQVYSPRPRHNNANQYSGPPAGPSYTQRQSNYNVPSAPAQVQYQPAASSGSGPRQAHHGGGSSYSSLHGFGAGNPGYSASAPAYTQPQPQYNFLGNSGIGAGAPKSPNYNAAFSSPPRYQGGSGGGASGMHSAINPYVQQGPAGPYNAGFDLGNGGTFSINFNPGQGQGFNPGQGQYNPGAQRSFPVSGGASLGSPSSGQDDDGQCTGSCLGNQY